MHLEDTLGITLHEVFDMFCGCSIGSVLAMGLGASKRTTHELRAICNDNVGVWPKVMPKPKNLVGPRYPSGGKRHLIETVIGDIKFSETDKMLVVPAFSLTLEETCIFDENSELYVQDVVEASTAAPTYFPSVSVDGQWYVDGGMTVYDPAMCGYVKAISKFGDADIRIISVGTGKRKGNYNGEAAQTHGVFGWLANDLIEITLNDTLVQKHLHTLVGDKYIRVQTYMEECGVTQELDDYSDAQFESLKKMGTLWWEKFGQDVLDLILLDEEELTQKFKLAPPSPEPTSGESIPHLKPPPFRLHHNLPEENLTRSPSLKRLKEKRASQDPSTTA